MMTGLMDKRKRSREDDFCESTPLSKRINNLHINNNNLEEPYHHHHHNHHSHHMELQNVPQQQHLNDNLQYTNGMHHNHDNHQVPQATNFPQYSYDPELSEHENPIYYNKNKLLHELHFERVKRNQI